MAGLNHDTSLNDQVASGVRWIAFGHVAAQLLGIGYTAVIARILDPSDYGVFAMAMIVIQIARYVEGLRLEAAIVQAEDVTPSQLSTAYVLLLCLGILFTMVFWLIAPVGTILYGDTSVVPIIRGLGFIFLLSALASVPRALASRRMVFRAIGMIQAIRVLPAGIVGIVLAINGFGVWSLVGYSLTQYAVESAAYLVQTRWLPSCRCRWAEIKQLVEYGRAATINGLLSYLLFNLPAALIGRYSGSTSLGIYQLANAVVTRPAALLYEVVRRVSFPVFAESTRSSSTDDNGYAGSLKGIIALSVPVCVGANILGRELVAILYGPGWTDAVPLVKILAPLAVLLPWISLLSSFIHAKGRPGVDARLRAITVVGIVASLPAAFAAGLEAVCWVIVIWFAAFTVMAQSWVNRKAGLSWTSVLSEAKVALVSASAMGLVLLLVSFLLRFQPGWIRLLTGGVAGTIAYVTCVGALDRSLARRVSRLLVGESARSRDW